MRYFILLVLVVPFFLNACVTSGKYDEMQGSRDRLMHDFDSLQAVSSKQITDLKSKNATLQKNLDVITDTYNQTKSKSSEDIARLYDSLQTTQTVLSAREQRLHDLEQHLAARDSTLNAVKARLNDALLGFKETGLSINIKNGKVY